MPRVGDFETGSAFICQSGGIYEDSKRKRSEEVRIPIRVGNRICVALAVATGQNSDDTIGGCARRRPLFIGKPVAANWSPARPEMVGLTP